MPAHRIFPDAGLLTLRLWIGVIGVVHGSQKLFGLFGGHGPRGFADFLASLGVPAPMLSGLAAGLAEFAGGILIGLGIAPRLAAAPFFITMIVGWLTAHGGRFLAINNGGEYALAVAAMLLTLILTGPGRFTLPALLRRSASAGSPHPAAA